MLFEPIIFTLVTTSDTSEDDSNNLYCLLQYVDMFGIIRASLVAQQ